MAKKKATKQERAAREKANPFGLDRPPPEGAMKLLRNELAEARATYDGRDKTLNGEAAAARRTRAVDAVTAVMMFLYDSGVRAEDQQPLIDILAAFTDHQRGKPNSLFASMKKAGGGTHCQIAVWRAEVAVAVALLIKAGEGKKAAVAHVADALTEAGIAGITPKRVDSWHREISSERFGNPAAIQIFKSRLAEDPADPRRAAEVLLMVMPDPPQEL